MPLTVTRRGFFNCLFTVFLKSRLQGQKTAPSASSARGIGSKYWAHPAPHVIWDVSMKSGGPWNLRGLRPEAREAARTAARRSGMSVGEWLNSVIKPADTEDREFAPSAGFDRDVDDSWRQSFGFDDRAARRHRDDANGRGRDRQSDDRCRRKLRAEEREQDRRPRDASWRERRSDDQSRQNLRPDARDQDRPQPDADKLSHNRRWDDQWRPSFGSDDREPQGPGRDANTHERERRGGRSAAPDLPRRAAGPRRSPA